MLGDSDTSILMRVVIPELDDLADEAAETLLRLHFDVLDIDRMTELGTLSSEARLSADQRTELDSYVRVGHLLSLIQSKARVSLRQVQVGEHAQQSAPATTPDDWFFNTNQTWAAGAYHQMLQRSVIALYGYPDGVGEAKFQRPTSGDRVFAYVNEFGVVSVGTFLDDEVFAGRGVFDDRQPRPREFHRRVRWDCRVQSDAGISSATVSGWGYRLPVRCTLAKMRGRAIGDRIRAELTRRQR